MSKEPVYRMKEIDSDASRLVRILDTYFDNAGADNFQIAVSDVEDIKTGERFKAIPRSRLTLSE